MKGLIQRVSEASVVVDGQTIGAIQRGILLLLGVERDDSEADASKLCQKITSYRIFPDEQGRMNRSLKDMAGGLALSTRSLGRKLEQEGASYRDLVEEERRQLALQLLNTTTMKIEELAAHLGYTDAGSFVRAFRRWEGCSPSAYREKA